MNILFIVPDFYPNSTGFANASINLINAIKKYGGNKYNIAVFTTVLLGDNEEVSGIEILRYRNSSFNNRFTHIYNERRKFNKLIGFIERFQADVIFFETNTFPHLEYWTLKKYGKKVFVRIHSTADTEVPVYGKHISLLDKLEYRKIKQFMLGVHNILSTSNYYLDFVKKHYLNDNVYSVWSEKTYDLLFNTSGKSGEGINIQKSNIFMTMGKMSENGITQKGITDLLKAVYYLKNENKIPHDFKLIVVGTGVRYSFIKQYVEKLEISNYVELLEKATHEEVFELISSAKAIVLLSRYEGQSMFITESISLGRPLILSDNNGMQDMIEDGKNGLVVRTGDAKAAASAMENMFSYDVDKLEEMSNKSLEIYNDFYSESAIYRQFDDIIKLFNCEE